MATKQTTTKALTPEESAIEPTAVAATRPSATGFSAEPMSARLRPFGLLQRRSSESTAQGDSAAWGGQPQDNCVSSKDPRISRRGCAAA
jgi:hypothetical protein